MAEAEPHDPEDLLAHAQDLRRLAHVLISDAHAAEDLAQEAMLELLRSRVSPSGIQNPAAWMRGLLRNLRLERARSEGRRRRREQAAARPEHVSDEQEIVERLEMFRELAAELEQLEEPYRTSLWRRFFEGATAEDIAAREGVTAAAVRSRWMRALAQLRERLDRRPGGRERWFPALTLLAFPIRAARESLSSAAIAAAAGLLATIVAVVFFLVPGGSPHHAALARLDEGGVSVALGDTEEPETTSARTLVASATSRDAPRSPLRLVLVDVWHREPIHACAVRVRARGETSEWITDESGRIVTSALPHGELGIEVLDDPRVASGSLSGEARTPRRARPLVHTGRDEVELVVPIGPTWTLALEMPPEARARELAARLFAPGREGARAASSARVRIVQHDADALVVNAWVRFGADAAALAGGGPWTLQVETSDARLAGETKIESLRERAEIPLELQLRERASARVRVRDHAGIALDARIEVHDARGIRVGGGDTKAGAFEIDGLERVPHVVRASALGLAPRTVEFTPSGSTTEVVLVLDGDVPRGRVSGVLRHGLERSDGLHVVLRDARGIELVQRIEATSAGRSSSSFVFEDVPLGEYELVARSRQVWSWTPSVQRVHPPAVGLEFEAVPSADAAPLVVKARDAATGDPIEHFDVRFELASGETVERSSSIGSATLAGPPRSVRLRWSLAAAGFSPARGDETALRGVGDRTQLDVRLERGFGLLVRALDDATGAPIADVRVLVDDMARARTDARGEALVTASDAPRTLRVELDGFTLVGGSIDAVTGAWWPSAPGRVDARLARKR